MDTTELQEACKLLSAALKAFGISLQEAAQAFSKIFNDVIEETASNFEDFLKCMRKKAKEPKKPNGWEEINLEEFKSRRAMHYERQNRERKEVENGKH